MNVYVFRSGCSYNHDSLVEKHWADVYHKVGDKSKKAEV